MATFIKILANASLDGAVSWPGEEGTTCPEWLLVSQVGAGGSSQQLQQIMGAAPCAERGAAHKHCIFVPPFSGHMQHTMSASEISGASGPQTSKLKAKYTTRNSHFFKLTNVERINETHTLYQLQQS